MRHDGTGAAYIDTRGLLLTRGLDWSVIAEDLNKRHDTIIAGDVLSKTATRPMAFVSTRGRSKLLADILGDLMLPSMEAMRGAIDRGQCIERMRRVTLAMLLYESEHDELPPVYTADADGNAFHSWRVLLLPYLGQQTLYEQIRLDEPWNSEHNCKFHAADVSFYQCPGAKPSAGQTTYSVVVGPDMPFEGSSGKQLAAFGPESGDMILVVERPKPFCWMDPTQDVPQWVADAGINVGTGIGASHFHGATFGIRSGGCRFLSNTIDFEVFKGMLRGTMKEEF